MLLTAGFCKLGSGGVVIRCATSIVQALDCQALVVPNQRSAGFLDLFASAPMAKASPTIAEIEHLEIKTLGIARGLAELPYCHLK